MLIVFIFDEVFVLMIKLIKFNNNFEMGCIFDKNKKQLVESETKPRSQQV